MLVKQIDKVSPWWRRHNVMIEVAEDNSKKLELPAASKFQ